MPALLLAALLFAALAPAAQAEAPTERYAPAQLRVAQDFLEQARAAARRGDGALAGKLAWQATLDARLTWGMTRSEALRSEAARIAAQANMVVMQVTARR